MSTHNICFYGELKKIILQLSSNTLLIWLSVMHRTWQSASRIRPSHMNVGHGVQKCQDTMVRDEVKTSQRWRVILVPVYLD